MEAFQRAPTGCFHRNLGQRPAAAQGRRGGVVGGRKRGMKCPPTNRFRLYAGHRSPEGKPAFSRIGLGILPRPLKNFAGRGGMRGLIGRVFPPRPAF